MKINYQPCPFCTNETPNITILETVAYVRCTMCNARGPLFEFYDPEEKKENLNKKENFSQEKDNYSMEEACEMAIERWNYRPKGKIHDDY